MSSATKRVMIVDDHDAVRRGVRGLVEMLPTYQVVLETGDGRLALQQAQECTPDIAILDFTMPELNGLELARQLKLILPRIEILMYTLHQREDFILEAMHAGVRGLVLKSDNEQQLIAALDALSLRRPYCSKAISETLIDRFMRQRPPHGGSILTNREKEIVQLIAEGYTNRQIAGILTISIKTVETHRASSMNKLSLRSTAELVRYAIRNNLIEA